MLANFQSRIKNNQHALLFVLFLLPIIWIKWVLPNPDSHNIELLQKRFNAREKEAIAYCKILSEKWKTDDFRRFDEFCSTRNEGFFVHVFRNDSLIYWNSNEFPISRFADLHFPVSGLIQLQNGWYYTKLEHSGNTVIAVSFGIQHQYPYLNEHLENTFFEPFHNEHFQIDPESSEFKLRNAAGELLVGLRINEQAAQHQAPLIWLFIFVLLEFVVVWHYLRQRFQSDLFRTILGFGILALHFICLRFNPFPWLENTELTDSGVLALGEWVPNMLELILWSLTGFLFTYSLWPVMRKRISTWPVVIGSLIILPAGIVLLPFLGGLLIENSSVPLELTNVLKLDYDSVFILFLFGSGGLYFVQLSYFALKGAKIRMQNQRGFLLYCVGIIAISGILAFLFLEEKQFIILWPLSMFLTVAYLIGWKDGVWSFSMLLFSLVLFSTATTVNINYLTEEKEEEAREIYAKNLAMEQDINTEVEFTELKQKMIHDDYCSRFFDSSIQPSNREVKEAFEHRFFNGFWEQYDLECYYFAKSDNTTRQGEYTHADLDELIARAGTVSEIDPDLYSIEDDQSQFVYCFRVPVVNDQTQDTVILYGGLKSKRIPEEIGFPRLLISESTNVFEALSDYSIAKYLDNRLIRNEGEADYPIDFRKLSAWKGVGIHWIETPDLSHVVYKKSNRNALVLSRVKANIMDSVTAIAFLVVAYGLLLLLTRLVILRSAAVNVQLSSLATRIQLVMIGLVVASLIGFSIGSGTFVQRQYDDYSRDIIRQKLRSLHLEAINSRELFKSPENKVTALEDQLIAWGRTFQTDLNFFDPDGFLVASSRPKLYNIGLLSEQMHPGARRVMDYDGKAESILEEKIGTLSYYSAYIPLDNPDGKFLGYLNVQHFAQQGAFETQLQSFFVAILNVFMLLLVLSIVGAVFVSSWITAPLRMIRRSVSNVAFGRHNEQIVYSSNDEIGALVGEYNRKLEELEEAASRLAQTEREEAWREMAKQVAHEIKNPLTPMKLSVQHLQRSFDPNDPNSEQKIQKVSAALIEQIEALTNIANAFSSFAKLPQPQIQEVDLIEVLRNVVQLFANDSEATVRFETEISTCCVDADKDMLIRVFNNIITNGIQSVAYGKKATVTVDLQVHNNRAWVSITDNGTGISKEQLNTIFEPYFTTKSTGTGLGLAMVKQIVELHGGSIEVTATSTAGSTFVVSLPVK